jgi:hypothetical protein
MIATKEHDDHNRVAVVTCGVTRTRLDAMEKRKGAEKWIRKSIDSMPSFNPDKERETYH